MDLHTCRWITSQQNVWSHFTSTCIPESNESVPLILSSFVEMASHPELKRHFHVLGVQFTGASLQLVSWRVNRNLNSLHRGKQISYLASMQPSLFQQIPVGILHGQELIFSSSHRFEAWN